MGQIGDCSPMAMFDLTGRRALVTGARRGIGRAIAMAFAAQGAHVAIHHAGSEEEQRDAESVLAQIRDRGGTAQVFPANFEQVGAGARLAAAAASGLGPIDILVLNASIELLEDYEVIPTKSFDRQIAVNLRVLCWSDLVGAALLLCSHAGRYINLLVDGGASVA